MKEAIYVNVSSVRQVRTTSCLDKAKGNYSLRSFISETIRYIL